MVRKRPSAMGNRSTTKPQPWRRPTASMIGAARATITRPNLLPQNMFLRMSPALLTLMRTEPGTTCQVTGPFGHRRSLPVGHLIVMGIGRGFLLGVGRGSMPHPGVTLPHTTAAGFFLADFGDGARARFMVVLYMLPRSLDGMAAGVGDGAGDLV